MEMQQAPVQPGPRKLLRQLLRLPASLGLNFGGRITVSTTCQSCLIFLTCMPCTLEPRSFKRTFVIRGKASVRSVAVSIPYSMCNGARHHRPSPYIPPRGTLMKREVSPTRGYRSFTNRLSLCSTVKTSSVKRLAMNIPVNYHGYPTVFTPRSDLDFPDSDIDSISSIGRSPRPRNSARTGRHTLMK